MSNEAIPFLIDSRLSSLEYEVRQLDRLTYEARVGRRPMTDKQAARIDRVIDTLERLRDEAMALRGEERSAA